MRCPGLRLPASTRRASSTVVVSEDVHAFFSNAMRTKWWISALSSTIRIMWLDHSLSHSNSGGAL